MDSISDFESNRSSNDDTPSPPHKPRLHASPPHTSMLHTAEDEISTPPSSPEEGFALNRTKTSDWLKAVSLDAADTTSVSETDVSTVIKTPLDSAKKVWLGALEHSYCTVVSFLLFIIRWYFVVKYEDTV